LNRLRRGTTRRKYAPLKAIRLANVRNDTILLDALADGQPYESWPQFTLTAQAQLNAFFGEADDRGVPPDRVHPGESVESVLAASQAAVAGPPATPAAAEALERVFELLPALDREGRQRVMARCQPMDS
jgi:hypothetical protein